MSRPNPGHWATESAVLSFRGISYTNLVKAHTTSRIQILPAALWGRGSTKSVCKVSQGPYEGGVVPRGACLSLRLVLLL